LSAAPPDPGLVNVYFDGIVVPADPSNGWTLTGSTITLVGAACDKVEAGNVLSIRIVAGCPTVIK
ncbi:MAG TPA: VWA domain-containing protein, partial [Polyangiaceae bacterium]